MYYCHKCAIAGGLINPAIPDNLTGEAYQLDKFIKHTAPTGVYSINSVFDDPSYAKYRDFVVTTIASGGVEVDQFDRLNLVWYAGEKTGALYLDGVYSLPESGIKVVLHDNEVRIHAFSFDFSPDTKSCQRCRGRLAY